MTTKPSARLNVVTELVLNHTSDQHEWFQRARRAPAGSKERDFYVWRDNSDGYKEARVIFQDFEPSNWAWDPVAKSSAPCEGAVWTTPVPVSMVT